MSIDTIERDFRQKVSSKVRLVAEGTDRYRVFTPYVLEDGDHLAVVLKKEGPGWVLSDEAHTYMRTADDLQRQGIIAGAISTFGIEDRGGELVLSVQDERFGDALRSFVQALLVVEPRTTMGDG